MNDEKLIELVRANPALYDQSNPKYMDTNMKNFVWKKIGTEMETDWSSIKVRWANIRDNFRKSLNKQKTTSSQKAKTVKPYKYSEQLQFLLKNCEERETFTCLDITNQDSTHGEQEEFSEYSSSHPPSQSEEINQPSATEETVHSETAEDRSQKTSTSTYSTKISGSKRKILNQSNYDIPRTAAATLMEYIIKRNEEKDKPNRFPSQDEVDAFLAGIAPVLKKLPPRHWFYAKGEIFSVVQKYEYKMLMNQQPANNEPRSDGPFSSASQPSGPLSDMGTPQTTSLCFQPSLQD